MTPNYSLPLETAYAQWVLDEDENQWVVYDKEGERLGKLPANLDEKQTMSLLRFARKFEKGGFDKGLAMGKDVMLAANSARLRQQAAEIEALKGMNEDLSAKLERFIIGEDED